VKSCNIKWYSNIELKGWLKAYYVNPDADTLPGVPFSYEAIREELALREYNRYEAQKAMEED
jgi:hypothetical protein